MTADLGSMQGHAGLCTLPLSRHKICPLWVLTSLHLDVLASFHYLCSLISYRMPATYSVDIPPFHISSLPNTLQHFFPMSFLDHPFSGPSQTPILVSYWFSQWSHWNPAVSLCPTGEPMGTEVQSSISLLLPI
jgi:hypothetical protein